jgi:predicted acylesterase/phospholipase RssA
MPEDNPEFPARYCDLVMKGGVTSGVVYPLAAVRLSDRFVFKNIGGTSAGAIAAAATAAAELARGRGGFDELRKLPEFLGAKPQGGGKSNMFMFFQPQHDTRRLFRLCTAGLVDGWLNQLLAGGRVVVSFSLAILLGAALGLAFMGTAWFSTSGGFLVFCLVVGLFVVAVGIIVGVAWAIKCDLQDALPRNYYGLCSGMPENVRDAEGATEAKAGQPLTLWLTNYLNSFLDRDSTVKPLTFGDLWGTQDSGEERKINLEMMTTCVTHGRPYRLPFREDDLVKENSLFYFRPDEFDLLFPKPVVQWMCDHPRPLEGKGEAEKEESRRCREYYLGQKYWPLPAPADLPVVVAVRMSLSFPVLLSAVPLHAVDHSRDKKAGRPERDLERCWFSDGGVCSNFPIHFFDSPLPRWPTLSINLVDKPDGTPDEDLRVPGMPESNSDGIQEAWNRFEVTERYDRATNQIVSSEKPGLGRIAGFGWALIATMQNWSDNVQSRLPGYRDRIARIGLTGEEGGLNLNMDPGKIAKLTMRGKAAGEEFIGRFGVPSEEPKMNWANHRWLRMRSFMASVEEMLKAMDRTCKEPQAPDPGYPEWIEALPPREAPGYQWTSAQKEMGVAALGDLRKIAESFGKANSMTTEAPRPRPELRPRARI